MCIEIFYGEAYWQKWMTFHKTLSTYWQILSLRKNQDWQNFPLPRLRIMYVRLGLCYLWFWEKLALSKYTLGSIHIWSSVRPKFGFGIGNWNQGPILVLEPKSFFFCDRNFNFSTFSHFFSHFLGIYKLFLSLKINPDLQKWFKNYLIFGKKTLVLGALLWWDKIPHAIGN